MMSLSKLHQAADIPPFDLILQAAALVEQEENRSEHSVKSNSINENGAKKCLSRATNKCSKLNTPINGYEADSELTIGEVSSDDHRLLFRRNPALTKNEIENEGSCLFVKSADRERRFYLIKSKDGLKKKSLNSTLLIKPIRPTRGRPRHSDLDTEPIQRKYQRLGFLDQENTKNTCSSLLDNTNQSCNLQVSLTHDYDIDAVGPKNSSIPSHMFFVEQETREFHNICEKNRRAHLKHRFDDLSERVPSTAGKRCSNLTILLAASRHIVALNRRNVELEAELRELALKKEALEKRRDQLLSDLGSLGVETMQIRSSLQSACSETRNSSETVLASSFRELYSSVCMDEETEDEASGSSTDSVPSSTKTNKFVRIMSRLHGGTASPSVQSCDSSTSTASEGEEGEDREDEATDEASEYGDVELSPEFLRKLPFRKRFHRLIKDVDEVCVNDTCAPTIGPPSMSVLQRTLTTVPVPPDPHAVSTDTLSPQFVNRTMHDIYQLLADVNHKPSSASSFTSTSSTPNGKSLITTLAPTLSTSSSLQQEAPGLRQNDSTTTISQNAAVLSRCSVTPHIFARLLINHQHPQHRLAPTTQSTTFQNIFPTLLQVAAMPSSSTGPTSAHAVPTPVIFVPVINSSPTTGAIQLVASVAAPVTSTPCTTAVVSESASFVNLTTQTLNQLLHSAVTITSVVNGAIKPS